MHQALFTMHNLSKQKALLIKERQLYYACV